MEENQVNVSDTEVTPVREQAPTSIRETLKQQLNNSESKEDNNAPEYDSDDDQQEENAVVEEAPQADRPVLVPPSDMNASERDAFLNPTPNNAHVLQQYLNRRAYETKVQYDRRMQEVNQLQRENAAVYDVIKQYEMDYAKEGISLGEIAKQSIVWDRAMKDNPTEAAIQWLESYGLSLNDLFNYQQQAQYQQPPNYLTREEAERIAEERYQTLAEEEQKKALEYYNQRVVDSFISQKPLFRDPETASQLETEMAPVVQALNATGRYSSAEEVLETAYNYVVNGNPTFAGIVQKMNAKPVIEQQQAVVQKAKAASKSISGSAGSGTPSVVTKDIRDNLRRRMSGD